jgi:HEAT repeat protein
MLQIQAPIIQAFQAANDDVRSAAATALGNVACGNLQVREECLPPVDQTIDLALA